jgi:hypothetical protein
MRATFVENVQVIVWLLATFGDVESTGTSTRGMEGLSPCNGAVFPTLLWIGKDCETSKLPRFTKYGQEPQNEEDSQFDPRGVGADVPVTVVECLNIGVIVVGIVGIHDHNHPLGVRALEAPGPPVRLLPVPIIDEFRAKPRAGALRPVRGESAGPRWPHATDGLVWPRGVA